MQGMLQMKEVPVYLYSFRPIHQIKVCRKGGACLLVTSSASPSNSCLPAVADCRFGSQRDPAVHVVATMIISFVAGLEAKKSGSGSTAGFLEELHD